MSNLFICHFCFSFNPHCIENTFAVFNKKWTDYCYEIEYIWMRVYAWFCAAMKWVHTNPPISAPPHRTLPLKKGRTYEEEICSSILFNLFKLNDQQHSIFGKWWTAFSRKLLPALVFLFRAVFAFLRFFPIPVSTRIYT